MNQAETIRAVADSAEVSHAEAERVLKALGNVAQAYLDADEIVLPGIGKLKAHVRAGRTGRNPRTGEPVEIPPSTTVKFSAAKALKDAINL